MTKDLKKICESATFESIFKRYAKDLRRFIFFKTNDLDTTEDLLQETFIKLWDNCDNVKYDSVKSYLYSVANNLFLNKIKHDKVVAKHQQNQPLRVTHESPEYVMLEKEFLDKIESTIQALPEKQREVFLLSRIEKKKYADIAKLLNISVKAVEKRMHLALKTMREKIGDV